MKKTLALITMLVAFASCNKAPKIPCHAWVGHSPDLSDEQIKAKFEDLKAKGIDGLMYNAGHNPAVYSRVGKIAKSLDLEFHTWIPTMLQGGPQIKKEWYAVNRLGESAQDKPAYVDYYKILCPNHEEVYNYIESIYRKVADVEEVDAVHLDYIRFPDVILAKGLWKKYGFDDMSQENAKADYCYCDKCVKDFKDKTGVDIKTVKDPSQLQEWKQFRYDLITNFVNKLAKHIHSKNKKVSAAVFPGPSLAKKLVRQEWDKWEIDAIYPMNYNDFYLEGTEWIGAMCKESSTAVANKRPIFSGLFICPDPEKKETYADPEAHGLKPSELEAAIRQSMENGATGICLFTPERMTPEDWEILNKALHTEYKSISN